MTALRYGVVSVFGNAANLLTITRIVGAPVLFWVILAHDDTAGASWQAFVFGWALGFTDFLDGKMARRQASISRTGAFLDPLADKLVVIGAMLCLIEVGRYAWLPVAIVIVREAAITAFRIYWAGRGRAVPARPLAKYKTIIQGVAVSMAVLPPLRDADTTVAVALWIAVAFTVWSGAEYVLDGRRATTDTGALGT